MKTVDEVKILAHVAVARIKEHKRVFKYLTYESGLKMLSYNNLQFTRADKLNDGVDCHFSKVDLNYVVETANSIGIDSTELVGKVIAKHQNPISSFGICSLGTMADNTVLWDRYTKTNGVCDGICIELDLNTVINCFIKRGIKIVALKVDYVDEVVESIPYQLFLGTEAERFLYIQLLIATKTRLEWEEEDEVRIFLPELLTEEYLRYELYKSCFKCVYLGQDVTADQRAEVQQVIDDAKLKLKIHTMNSSIQ